MDILAMIASAVGGIVLWNLFFASGKQTKCEVADTLVRGHCSDSTILLSLENAFGSADLDYVFKVGKASTGAHRCSDSTISLNLENLFGTADLDYILKTFAPQTRKKMIEVQKSNPSK